MWRGIDDNDNPPIANGNRVATKQKIFCRRNNFSISPFLLANDPHRYIHTQHIHSEYYGVKPGILLLLFFPDHFV